MYVAILRVEMVIRNNNDCFIHIVKKNVTNPNNPAPYRAAVLSKAEAHTRTEST